MCVCEREKERRRKREKERERERERGISGQSNSLPRAEYREKEIMERFEIESQVVCIFEPYGKSTLTYSTYIPNEYDISSSKGERERDRER